jgi:hypothetical protein
MEGKNDCSKRKLSTTKFVNVKEELSHREKIEITISTDTTIECDK